MSWDDVSKSKLGIFLQQREEFGNKHEVNTDNPDIMVPDFLAIVTAQVFCHVSGNQD